MAPNKSKSEQKRELEKYQIGARNCAHFSNLSNNVQGDAVPLSYLSSSTIDVISSLLSRKVLIHYRECYPR